MANTLMMEEHISQELVSGFQFVSVPSLDVSQMVKKEWTQDTEELEDTRISYTLKVEPYDEIKVEENNIDTGDRLDGASACSFGGHNLPNKTCMGDESAAKSTSIGLEGSPTNIKDQESLLHTIFYRGEHHGTNVPECSELLSDVKVNPSERPHGCHICGKRFHIRSKLLVHFETHSDARPHVCKECGKCFTTRRYLTGHMKFHVVQRPHVCNHCGKGFTCPTLLKAHVTIHSGERPYICSHCGKGFRTSNHLNVHLKIHSGERPHVCQECGKGFISRSHLKSHLIWHSGEKSLECDECGKLFSQRSNLISHIKIHTGERSKLSNECGVVSTAKYLQSQSGERCHLFSENFTLVKTTKHIDN